MKPTLAPAARAAVASGARVSGRYPAGVRPLQIPRWIQLVSLPLTLLLAWTLAAELTTTLEVFVISGLIALLLNPLVHALTVLKLPRGLSVLIVYLAFFGASPASASSPGAAAVNQLSNAAQTVQDQFTKPANGGPTPADQKIDDLQRWLDGHGLERVHIRTAGQQAVAKIEKQGVTGYVQKAIDVGSTLATAIVSGVIHLILILVVSIYMLLDAPRLARFVNRIFPPGPDGRELGREAQRALASYVRGQFMVSLIIGLSAGLSMEAFGLLGIWPQARGYALFFGLFAMATEAIPYVGPILGAVPPIVLALFDQPDHGALGGARVPRDPPARGPRRRAARDGQRAAQPSARGDLRAARGRGALRGARRDPGAAAARRRARRRGLHRGARQLRAVAPAGPRRRRPRPRRAGRRRGAARAVPAGPPRPRVRPPRLRPTRTLWFLARPREGVRRTTMRRPLR